VDTASATAVSAIISESSTGAVTAGYAAAVVVAPLAVGGCSIIDTTLAVARAVPTNVRVVLGAINRTPDVANI
jgi:hypothetical protein